MAAQFETDSFATPARRTQVYRLLGTAFGGMDSAIPKMEPLGAVWHELSTPFVIWKDGEPVSHVGVLEIDLVVEGESLRVPGIHAVCTHPDHRGRGHARELMERALVHIDARFETSILFADVPAMYEKFGYRTLPQSRFTASVQSERGRGFEPFRDVRRIHEMLAVREPVSNVLGCVRTEYMFFCDLLLAGLGLESVYHAADLVAVVVYRVDDGVLNLFDVVARELPSLEQILNRVDAPIREIRFGFTPDRFGEADASPLEDDIFMVRGPWPKSDQPFRFPYLAHC